MVRLDEGIEGELELANVAYGDGIGATGVPITALKVRRAPYLATA